jgi:two-component system, chemotaxis family, sensor kinase CheA
VISVHYSGPNRQFTAAGAAMDDLLADFLTETNENLAELDVALLALERTPDDVATLGLIFRMVHTIKGTCGFLGLPRLERVAHSAENILGQLRDGTLSASPDMVSQILAALDRIKAILAGLSQSGADRKSTRLNSSHDDLKP